MKKIKILSCFLFLLFTLSSCNQTLSEIIIGEWKIIDFESTADFDEEELYILRNDMIKNEKYTFTKEKLIISYRDITTNWVWRISKRSNNLIIISDIDGESKRYVIIKKSSKKIILHEDIFDEHIETRTLEKIK